MYTTPYETTTAAPAISPVVWIIYIAILVFELAAIWKIFAKAGQPGWAAIIPIYNIVVLLRVVKLDWWHIFIMLFVPFAAMVYMIIINYKMAIVFGKGSGFGVLNIFFSGITYPILGFGSAQYVDSVQPTGAPVNVEPVQPAGVPENMEPVQPTMTPENVAPTDNTNSDNQVL